MKTSLFSALILSLLIIAMPVQQAEAQVEGASFDALIASLGEAIELTDQQQEQLRSFAADHDLDATSLWRFSAELHETLSDEQRSTLHHESQGMRGEHRMRGERERRGMEGRSRMSMPRFDIPLNPMHPMLSDEQREQLSDLMNSAMETFRSTWQEFRGEDFDREELQRDMRSLRDSVQSQMRNLLTEEQYEALKEEGSERERREWREDRPEREERGQRMMRRHMREHDGEHHMMQGNGELMHEHHFIMQTHHAVLRHLRQLQSD